MVRLNPLLIRVDMGNVSMWIKPTKTGDDSIAEGVFTPDDLRAIADDMERPIGERLKDRRMNTTEPIHHD